MPFEIDRAGLVEQIETVFTDARSTKERAIWVHQLRLVSDETLPYEAQEIEAVFRDRVWQTVAFEHLDQLRDLDSVAELSDDALIYYLPALLIMALSDPSWLVNQETLEQRMIGSFGGLPAVQRAAAIAFVDYMVAYYSYLISQQEDLDEDQPYLDVEEIEYRLLMYLDEKRDLTAQQSEP